MFHNTTEQIKSSNLYFPEFGGSTGGWLESAEMEEKYVLVTEKYMDLLNEKMNVMETKLAQQI